MRWALLRFPARAGETVRVRFEEAAAVADAPDPPVRLTTNGPALRLDNGVLELDLDRAAGLRAVRCGGRAVCREAELSLTLQETGGPRALRAGPAESFSVLFRSGLSAELRWRGRFVDSEGRPGPMSYDLRLRADAVPPAVRLWRRRGKSACAWRSRAKVFHAATLFDPTGAPVQRVQRFVDFEDPGRYELELKAPVTGPRQGWSLELNAVRVLRGEDFLPWWSARPEDWFNPEQSGAFGLHSP